MRNKPSWMTNDYRVASNDALLALLKDLPAEGLKTALLGQIREHGLTSNQRSLIEEMVAEMAAEMHIDKWGVADQQRMKTEKQMKITLQGVSSDFVQRALEEKGILRAIDHLPYESAEGGYQFVGGPQMSTEDIFEEFEFRDMTGELVDNQVLDGIIFNLGPWFRNVVE